MHIDYSQTSLTLLNLVGAGGDPLAERRFVERYGQMVRRIAKAARLDDHDADDVVQETMIAAVQALRENRYDRQRGRFKVWLKGVLYHKIAHLRRKSTTPCRAAGFSPRGPSPTEGLAGFSPRGPFPPADGLGTEGESSSTPPIPVGGRVAEETGGRWRASSQGGRRGRADYSHVPLTDIADPAPTADEQVEAAFEKEWMKAIYEEAAEEVRTEVEPHTWQAFDLVANHGWSPAETARFLGIRRSAVDNAKCRVLKRLKDKVAGFGCD
ncbi:MAG: hypothetical protein FLDDKLPJ_02273 [Phycisphaerae bacterium]|nr:hypothetical protein [Phycisphaerae bacterium]